MMVLKGHFKALLMICVAGSALARMFLSDHGHTYMVNHMDPVDLVDPENIIHIDHLNAHSSDAAEPSQSMLGTEHGQQHRPGYPDAHPIRFQVIEEQEPSTEDNTGDELGDAEGSEGLTGSSPGEPDDPERTDTVDDIEEIDLDDDIHDEESIGYTLRDDQIQAIQAVLTEYIQIPSDLATIYQTLNTTDAVAMTEKEQLYHHILRQCVSPLHSNIHILDPEVLLSLKGSIYIAQHPQLRDTYSQLYTQATRAVRIQNPGKLSANSHFVVHMMLAKALAHSMQSHWIVLNDRSFGKILQACKQHPLLSEGSIYKVHVLQALVQLIEKSEANHLIVCNDNLQWLLHNQAASDFIQTQLSNRQSKLMMLFLQPNTEIRSLANVNNMEAAAATGAGGQSQAGNQMLSNLFGTSSPSSPPPSSMPNMHPMHQHMPMGLPVRGYQISISNGTATLQQLPPDARPPEAVMRKFMEAHKNQPGMHAFNQSGDHMFGQMPMLPPGGVSFPMFPPEMSEEDIQEFMQEPENQAKIKGMIDQVMQMLGHQMAHNPNMFNQPGQMHLPSLHGASSQPQHVHMQQPQPPSQQQLLQNMNSMKSNIRLPGTMFKQIHRQANQANSKKTEGMTIPKDAFADSPSISTCGQQILQKIEDVVIELPADHAQKQLWQGVVSEDIGQRIFNINKRIFISELQKHRVLYSLSSLVALHDVLKKQVLSREQVKQAIMQAIRLQLGHHTQTQQQVQTQDIEHTAAADQDIYIHYWSLDIALSHVCKHTPHIGKGVSHSREDILNTLQLDKYEKTLVGSMILPQDIGVGYSQIGGLDEAKKVLRQCISYPLKYPRLYSQGLANEAIKGLLLFGPPGTGKTMLAKAIATEGGASFLSIDSSTIENKWLGESEKNARAVFSLARKIAPCIIYLDEVDSILSSREHSDESSHGTLTSVKTTLMQEWDGLRTTNDRVVVIASTNRPFDLDEAVLRRLPRRILVDLPDLATRQDILKVSLRQNPLDANVNLTQLAQQLEGYTGSDIKEICREACVKVAHERAACLEAGSNGMSPMAEKRLEEEMLEANAPLRPVNSDDFLQALRKLKASVDDAGREMAKVQEWNEKYGEVKRKGRKKHGQLNMYI